MELVSRYCNAVNDAEVNLYRFLQKEFPVGTVIEFNHNGYLQKGEVLAVYSNEFRVQNLKTGCVRRVGLYDLRGRLSKWGMSDDKT